MNLVSVKYGVYGGLTGGVVFGAMMGMMGMFPMIGQMVGSPTVWAGFLMHMMISAMIGATFAVLVEWTGRPAGIGLGLAYGALWWILGPLTLMPLFMGMGVGANWNVAAFVQAMPLASSEDWSWRLNSSGDTQPRPHAELGVSVVLTRGCVRITNSRRTRDGPHSWRCDPREHREISQWVVGNPPHSGRAHVRRSLAQQAHETPKSL